MQKLYNSEFSDNFYFFMSIFVPVAGITLNDVYATKEQFIDTISRYFSDLLHVRPQDLPFRFESPQPLGDLNAT